MKGTNTEFAEPFGLEPVSLVTTNDMLNVKTMLIKWTTMEADGNRERMAEEELDK